MNWNKIRTEFFDQCTEEINGLKKVNLAPHDLFNWFKDKCRSKTRSTKANALYWLWMQCLEDETGTDKYEFHDDYKDRHIGISMKEVRGRNIIKEPSTKGMLSGPYNSYMKKVQADAAIELRIILPLPEDQGFDQFMGHYKDYL